MAGGLPAPFGEVISVTGPASLDARFPGQWFQLESGLAYNWHRHYDASLGRYTQPDPLGVKAGPSVYGYADGNPVMWVDPEGLDINVCFYADAAAGFGHVGFGVTGESGTQGFYPTGNPLNSPGVIRPDTQNNMTCKTVGASPEEDNCMRSCRSDRATNPGRYTLMSRQCTGFVRDCLRSCRLWSGKNFGSRPGPSFDELPGK